MWSKKGGVRRRRRERRLAAAMPAPACLLSPCAPPHRLPPPASIGQTVAPVSDFRMGTKRHFSRIPPYPAVVVPPGELHTAPMGMKLGSYPGLGTDGLWCKGLALFPRQWPPPMITCPNTVDHLPQNGTFD